MSDDTIDAVAGAAKGFNLAAILKGGVEGVLSSIGDIIGRFKANPEIMAKADAEIRVAAAQLETAKLQYAQQVMLAQIEVNKIEAANASWFTSNWRPATGWICNLGFAYAFVLRPFVTWISGWIATGHPPAAPDIDTVQILELLGGLLGLTLARSFDKLNGTARP